MTTPKSPNPTPEETAVTPTDPLCDEFHERNYQLNRRDAAAGAPADASVTGEEDPGAGLEFLVRK
jgi:hypothetical protein